MTTVPAQQLVEYVGRAIGVSDWFEIDQARVDAFADVTLDHQFIHIDPAAAAATPFGGTIAHGFLTLSLVTHLTTGLLVQPEGAVMAINYGSDRVRFLEPVRVGSRIRARVTLLDAVDKGGGRWLLKSETTIEIDGGDKPALVAEVLIMFVVA